MNTEFSQKDYVALVIMTYHRVRLNVFVKNTFALHQWVTKRYVKRVFKHLPGW